jgi:nitrogen regulatory protein PII
MRFKLITVFAEDSVTQAVIDAARHAGATGCTVINQARGEGFEAHKSFFGLSLTSQTDVVMLLVEQHMSRDILEEIGRVGQFDAKPGTGVAFQVDVEDAVGVMRQAEELAEIVEEQL